MSCGVLRCVAVVHDFVLAHTLNGSVLQCVAVSCGVLRCVTVAHDFVLAHSLNGSVLQCVVVSCGVTNISISTEFQESK